jgi:spore maturation protein CgeB
VGRRANRDDHAMRTYELPAMAACMLVENTPHHRQLFGADGEAVVYFDTIDEAVGRARDLLADEALRTRCRRAVRALITDHPHTYADRLAAMLAVADDTSDETRTRHSRTLSRV